MSLLISVKEAEFTFIKEKTNSTAGNLSVQVQKLKDAGYIEVNKQFKDNYPLTTCKITKQGIQAFEDYVKALQEYLNAGKWVYCSRPQTIDYRRQLADHQQLAFQCFLKHIAELISSNRNTHCYYSFAIAISVQSSVPAVWTNFVAHC